MDYHYFKSEFENLRSFPELDFGQLPAASDIDELAREGEWLISPSDNFDLGSQAAE